MGTFLESTQVYTNLGECLPENQETYLPNYNASTVELNENQISSPVSKVHTEEGNNPTINWRM